MPLNKCACIFFIITGKIFLKRINLYLGNNFQEFHSHPDTKFFLHEQPLVSIPRRTPDSFLPLSFPESNDFFLDKCRSKRSLKQGLYMHQHYRKIDVLTNSSMLLCLLFCYYRSSNNSRKTLEKRLQRNSIFNKITKTIKD